LKIFSTQCTGHHDDAHEPICFWEEEVLQQASAAAIGRLKSQKAAGKDEIRPEMLKKLNSEGIFWLT